MSLTTERPGVYVTWSVTGALYSGAAGGVAGVAARSVSGTSGAMSVFGSEGEAAAAFGAGADITALVKLLFANGAQRVKAVPLIPQPGQSAPGDGDYESAFALLAAERDVGVIITDSASSAVHGHLKAAIAGADEAARHKLGIVESDAGTAAGLVAAAQGVNGERIVLAAPSAVTAQGTAAVRGSVAAALAGAVLTMRDPAIPLNGTELFGLEGLGMSFTDGELTTLIQGGVTPVESVGGSVSVVRGITSRSLAAGGGADATWRELNTVLIIDDVIPAVRQALKSGFARVKNTAQTRGAIRTRVIVELEKKVAAEIIDSYANVRVAQNGEDPTVCDVSFDFTVAHGLNQISVTANITI